MSTHSRNEAEHSNGHSKHSSNHRDWEHSSHPSHHDNSDDEENDHTRPLTPQSERRQSPVGSRFSAIKQRHDSEIQLKGKTPSATPTKQPSPPKGKTDGQLEIEMNEMMDKLAEEQEQRERLSGERKDFHMKLWKTPKETAVALQMAAVKKSQYPLDKLAVLGFEAGIFVAVGGCFALLASQGIPGIAADNPAIPKLLTGATFPIALLLIVAFGGELFTGNTMYFTAALLAGKVQFKHLALNWAVVWTTNFIGCVTGAFLLGYITEIFELDPWRTGVEHLAWYKVENYPVYVYFFRAIPANMLVCLAIFLAISSEDMISKIVGMYLPVACFASLGYEHTIANMFFVPVGLMYGADTTFWRFVYRNLIVTTLGNIIGGAICVGALSYYLYCSGSNGESQKMWKWSFVPTA